MNTLSAAQLKKYLTEYSLHIEYWEPHDGDGNELLGCREILKENYNALSLEDQNTLHRIDSEAAQILIDYDGDNSFDIEMLKKAINISTHNDRKAA